MATPAAHKTLAESLLAAAATQGVGINPAKLPATTADWRLIATHATLGLALGTGAHYAASEAAIAICDQVRGNGRSDFFTLEMQSQIAYAQALLADR